MIEEAKLCNIQTFAFSEHRWKVGEHGCQISVKAGCENWSVLASVHETGGPTIRGVGIALSPTLSRAWKSADQVFVGGGQRVMRTCLKMPGAGPGADAGQPRWYRFISAIVVYAPTYQCSDEDKYECWQQLGDALALVPANDFLVLLGDMNAHVGVADPDIAARDAGLWKGVSGPCGIPQPGYMGRRTQTTCGCWTSGRCGRS